VEQTGGAQDRPGAKPPSPTEPNAPSSSHTTSPELEALLAAVAQLPAVRPDVVANVSARLGAGEVLTPARLTATAAALLAPGTADSQQPGADVASPSPELLSWTAALQQAPLSRPDVVAEASRKVAAGELSTPEAIRRTAGVILA
jgi:hypothetical protein